MQTIPGDRINLIVIATLIFLLAPLSIIIYIIEYNRRKRKHHEEKIMMQSLFAGELIKTQLEVQEQTLQTVGINLHDNIGQLLSLISITLGSIQTEATMIQGKIDSAIQLTEKSIHEIRLLGKLMQGEQLIGHGLKEAISQELNWLSNSDR